MDTSNIDQNQNVQVVTPQVTNPRKRHIGRWLTLAVVVLLVGAGSMFLTRDNTSKNVSAQSGAAVEISKDGFVPQTIRIKKGESVTWMNKDDNTGTPHQVASNDQMQSIGSHGPLAQGETYTASFDNTGTYSYYDVADPVALKGIVIVEE